MSNEILVAPAMELVTFTIPLTGKTGWLVVRTSILVDVARLSHPALLLLVVVKLSKVGFAASASTVNEYVRSAARVLPTVSFKEYAGILMWMISPAGYFCVPVSDMVMTCRVIDVAIVSVMELLEESTRRGFKAPPLLYEIDSSKYRVIVDSLRTPVAPLAGAMEVVHSGLIRFVCWRRSCPNVIKTYCGIRLRTCNQEHGVVMGHHGTDMTANALGVG